jgi:DNA-binding transcriptional regulator PaaX
VALATSVAGVAVGAAATNNLIKALADLGILEERARVYIDRLIQSDYLVIVSGTDNDIQSAQAILNKHPIQYWDVYQHS